MTFRTLKEFQRSFPLLLQASSLIGKKGAKNEEHLIAPYLKGTYGRSVIFSLNALEKNLITITNFLCDLKNKKAPRKPRILFVSSNHFLKYLQKPVHNPEIIALMEKLDLALAPNLTPGCLADWNTKILQPTIDFLTLPEFLHGDFQKNRYAYSLRALAPLKARPDLIIFLSAELSHNTLKECQTLQIPTITIVNSNGNPKYADYIIPASDSLVSQFIIFNILYQTLLNDYT